MNLFNDESLEPVTDSDTSQSFLYGQEPKVETPEETQPIVDGETPAVVPDNNQPQMDNWEVRARYFQSEFDKLKNEVTPFMPVIRGIQEKPELIDLLQEKLIQPVVPVEPVPVAPVRPEKPRDFNMVEALNDSDSASYKYQEALLNYQEQLTDYHSKKEEYRAKKEMEFEQQRQDYEQRMRFQQEQQQKLGQLGEILTNEYKMPPQEQSEFIKEFSNPNSISIANLVQLYRLKKGMQQPQGTQKQNQPLPPAFGGSSGNVKTDPNEAFAAMLRQK